VKKEPPAPDDPRYLRTCTRCGHVRHWRHPCIVVSDPETGERRGVPPGSGLKGEPGWTDFGCPQCGNPEFSLPGGDAAPIAPDRHEEGQDKPAEEGRPRQLLLWD
jgi:hypothetical protein